MTQLLGCSRCGAVSLFLATHLPGKSVWVDVVPSRIDWIVRVCGYLPPRTSPVPSSRDSSIRTVMVPVPPTLNLLPPAHALGHSENSTISTAPTYWNPTRHQHELPAATHDPAHPKTSWTARPPAASRSSPDPISPRFSPKPPRFLSQPPSSRPRPSRVACQAMA